MTQRPAFRAAAALALLMGAAAAQAAAAEATHCRIRKVELPVTMAGMTPLVAAKINEQDARFVLDSGAFFSMLVPAAADELHLRRHRAPEGLRVEGIGGYARPDLVRVERFVLKNTVLPNVDFLVAGNSFASGAVGLLGRNFLMDRDVEYDLAQGRIFFATPGEQCHDALLAYWAPAASVSELPLERDRRGIDTATKAYIEINGGKILAMFDTGAASSMLTRRAARDVGLEPGGAGVVYAGERMGIGRRTVKSWTGPVRSVALGGETIRNTRLMFSDADLDDVGMLIGADFFLAHHIYVANSQDKLYFTYNGGPVFNLQAGTAPAAADAVQGAPLADAAAYANRGSAYLSRRDYAHALMDFNRACELEPAVGHHYYLRGQAYLGAGHPESAAPDFDEALRLDPGDVDARLARAELFLRAKDPEAARKDLEMADRFLSKESGIHQRIAADYLALGMPEAALPQLDSWIRAHENDAMAPAAHELRCWARARTGIALEDAIDDCTIALNRHERSVRALGNRGLAYLRLGRYDRAMSDFDETMKIDPGDALALYGRGVARLKRGERALGMADIAAAKQMRATVEDEARGLAIVP